MADNIIVTKDEGVGSTFTLYGTADLGKAAGRGKPVWTQLEMSSADPWEKITYAGFSSINPKFLGAKTNQIAISGFMVDSADDDGQIVAGMRDLLRKNKERASWKIALGGTNISDVTDGAILRSVVANIMGEGSGPRWPFVLVFQNIGPDKDTPGP